MLCALCRVDHLSAQSSLTLVKLQVSVLTSFIYFNKALCK